MRVFGLSKKRNKITVIGKTQQVVEFFINGEQSFELLLREN